MSKSSSVRNNERHPSMASRMRENDVLERPSGGAPTLRFGKRQIMEELDSDKAEDKLPEVTISVPVDVQVFETKAKHIPKDKGPTPMQQSYFQYCCLVEETEALFGRSLS